MRPKPRSRMPSITALRHVEADAEIGLDHRVPLLEAHALHRRVAGDAGIVDQHVDRAAERRLDRLDALGAGVEIGDVEFEDRDAGLGREFLRRLVVAAVIGGDLVAGVLQRDRDRAPMPRVPPVTTATLAIVSSLCSLL